MGKAIAELYAKEGAKVVVSDYNFEGAQAVVEDIQAAATSTYGKLNILENNAGISTSCASKPLLIEISPYKH